MIVHRFLVRRSWDWWAAFRDSLPGRSWRGPPPRLRRLDADPAALLARSGVERQRSRRHGARGVSTVSAGTTTKTGFGIPLRRGHVGAAHETGQPHSRRTTPSSPSMTPRTQPVLNQERRGTGPHSHMFVGHRVGFACSAYPTVWEARVCLPRVRVWGWTCTGGRSRPRRSTAARERCWLAAVGGAGC